MDIRPNIILTHDAGSGVTLPKNKVTVLTTEERDILISSGLSQNGKLLSNTEIGQRLGMSDRKVKRLMHQVFIKLEVHNRNKAINLALKRREIILTDLWSIDEIAEIFSSLGPEMLRRIANVVRQRLEHKHLLRKNEQTSIVGRRQDGILNNRERDVVSLAGPGLENKEIAEILYISIGSVRILLSRACNKLGANSRSEVFILALKKREISVADVYSLNEVIKYLAPLGVKSIEKMAQLVERKLWQEPISIGS